MSWANCLVCQSLLHLLDEDDIVYLVGFLGVSKEMYVKHLLVSHTQRGAGKLCYSYKRENSITLQYAAKVGICNYFQEFFFCQNL